MLGVSPPTCRPSDRRPREQKRVPTRRRSHRRPDHSGRLAGCSGRRDRARQLRTAVPGPRRLRLGGLPTDAHEPARPANRRRIRQRSGRSHPETLARAPTHRARVPRGFDHDIRRRWRPVPLRRRHAVGCRGGLPPVPPDDPADHRGSGVQQHPAMPRARMGEQGLRVQRSRIASTTAVIGPGDPENRGREPRRHRRGRALRPVRGPAGREIARPVLRHRQPRRHR